jgi:hypothetical protein
MKYLDLLPTWKITVQTVFEPQRQSTQQFFTAPSGTEVSGSKIRRALRLSCTRRIEYVNTNRHFVSRLESLCTPIGDLLRPIAMAKPIFGSSKQPRA